ncbi:MAG: TlpA disulfide reductase family protein [Candidatus Kapaibacteriota bacterium]
MTKLVLFMMFFCINSMHAQVQKISIGQLEQVLSSKHDSVYVINFWATWCKPCIEELPYFEEAYHEFKKSNVRILLVSLDMASELERIVIPFIQKKKMLAEIVLLDEPDPNSWIDRIEPTWSGSLPATIIFNNSLKKRSFQEKQLTKEELFLIIQQLKE